MKQLTENIIRELLKYEHAITKDTEKRDLDRIITICKEYISENNLNTRMKESDLLAVPEGFVQINMPDKPFTRGYFVNADGQIYSARSKSLMSPFIGANGCLQIGVTYSGKLYFVSVHRAVASTFLNNPNHLSSVRHKNGNKLDNRIENLEWSKRR